MSLIYGISETGEKINIVDYTDRDIKVFSPLGKPLIGRRGNKNVHHFSHRYSGDRDSWAHPIMTPWHYSYQTICRPERVEVRIEKEGVLHIADIFTDKGLVVELQHSSIYDDDILEREQFYGDMIWLFDYSLRTTPQGKQIFRGRVIFTDKSDTYIKVRLSAEPKRTTKPTFYDVGTCILEFIGVDRRSPYNKEAWFKRHTRKEFIDKYMSGIVEKQYDHKSEFGLTYERKNDNKRKNIFVCHYDVNHDPETNKLSVQTRFRFALNKFFTWSTNEQLGEVELVRIWFDQKVRLPIDQGVHPPNDPEDQNYLHL